MSISACVTDILDDNSCYKTESGNGWISPDSFSPKATTLIMNIKQISGTVSL